jgi:hypothetical protein
MISPPLPIYFSGNLRFKKSITSLWRCRGAPSCWNSTSSGPSSYNVGMRNSTTRDTILTTLSVALQVEKSRNSSDTNYQLDYIPTQMRLVIIPLPFSS